MTTFNIRSKEQVEIVLLFNLGILISTLLDGRQKMNDSKQFPH
jgi:hypothetical protein